MDILKFFRKEIPTIGKVYGPGVRQQLEKAKVEDYDKLTMEVFNDFLKEISKAKYNKGERLLINKKEIKKYLDDNDFLRHK